jgi:hypothetical protein
MAGIGHLLFVHGTVTLKTIARRYADLMGCVDRSGRPTLLRRSAKFEFAQAESLDIR